MITVTAYELTAEAGGYEEVESESFADVIALAAELEQTAGDDYRDRVLSRVYDGELKFTVQNGPGAYDTYEVS